MSCRGLRLRDVGDGIGGRLVVAKAEEADAVAGDAGGDGACGGAEGLVLPDVVDRYCIRHAVAQLGEVEDVGGVLGDVDEELHGGAGGGGVVGVAAGVVAAEGTEGLVGVTLRQFVDEGTFGVHAQTGGVALAVDAQGAALDVLVDVE